MFPLQPSAKRHLLPKEFCVKDKDDLVTEMDLCDAFGVAIPLFGQGKRIMLGA